MEKTVVPERKGARAVPRVTKARSKEVRNTAGVMSKDGNDNEKRPISDQDDRCERIVLSCAGTDGQRGRGERPSRCSQTQSRSADLTYLPSPLFNFSIYFWPSALFRNVRTSSASAFQCFRFFLFFPLHESRSKGSEVRGQISIFYNLIFFSIRLIFLLKLLS